MKQYLFLIIFFLVLTACQPEAPVGQPPPTLFVPDSVQHSQSPSPTITQIQPEVSTQTATADVEVLFENSFEEEDPFPADGSLWSKVRLQTGPGQPESTWERSTEVAHSGQYSVKLFAAPGTEDQGFTCGKASMKKLGLPIVIGDTVTYSAWFYLPTTDVPVHLMDVECPGECGLMGGPGVRVLMTRDGRLRLDWKFLNWYKNMGQPSPIDAPPQPQKGTHILPAGEWFELTLRMTLDNQGRGLTEVYVNGELDSAIQGTNIAPEGLEALNKYPQLEVGINCNVVGNPDTAVLYVDDVRITRQITPTTPAAYPAPSTQTTEPVTAFATSPTSPVVPTEPIVSAEDFALVHPGLLSTQEELEDMHIAIQTGAEPQTTAVAALLAENANLTNYKNHQPQAVNIIEAKFRGSDETPGHESARLQMDAEIAYGAALLWIAYGDTAYADQVVRIVNAWTNTFERMEGENVDLIAATSWPAMVWAAEIVRHTYNGWDEAEVAAFESLLLEKVYPFTRAVDDIDRGKPGPGNYQAWGIAARMSIAVFADRADLFEQAVADYRTMIDGYVLTNGQPLELCRGDGDLFHTQMGMMPLLVASEIAANQGVELLSYASTQSNMTLLDAFRFVAPFVAFDSRTTDTTHWPCQKPLGEHPLGVTPWPGWELACTASAGDEHIADVADYVRDWYGGSDYFSKLGWTTITHPCK
ncbi:MAG: hypothetical protein D6706_01455 [Chloroflexi bacterium]|nr:MAG: hypothetical protein D6706_01455 [Chloroflexota bacterium]